MEGVTHSGNARTNYEEIEFSDHLVDAESMSGCWAQPWGERRCCCRKHGAGLASGPSPLPHHASGARKSPLARDKFMYLFQICCKTSLTKRTLARPQRLYVKVGDANLSPFLLFGGMKGREGRARRMAMRPKRDTNTLSARAKSGRHWRELFGCCWAAALHVATLTPECGHSDPRKWSFRPRKMAISQGDLQAGERA